jgi:hypothetical protein
LCSQKRNSVTEAIAIDATNAQMKNTSRPHCNALGMLIPLAPEGIRQRPELAAKIPRRRLLSPRTNFARRWYWSIYGVNLRGPVCGDMIDMRDLAEVIDHECGPAPAVAVSSIARLEPLWPKRNAA